MIEFLKEPDKPSLEIFNKVERRSTGEYIINGVYLCRDENDPLWDRVIEWLEENEVQDEYVCPESCNEVEKQLWYFYGFKHTDTVPNDIKAKAIRECRHKRFITEIDRYTAVDLMTMTDEQKAKLVAHRQKLRDIPQQAGFPNNVKFPERLIL